MVGIVRRRREIQNYDWMSRRMRPMERPASRRRGEGDSLRLGKVDEKTVYKSEIYCECGKVYSTSTSIAPSTAISSPRATE